MEPTPQGFFILPRIIMSYEGYEQYLCENGHLWEEAAYFTISLHVCPVCRSRAVFCHSVDETNGIEYDENNKPYPHTIPYPFKQIGCEDIECVDKYGNKYYLDRPIYEIPRKE